jgi:hypothetical protein
VITLPQALREGLERDLEKNATTYVETSSTRNMTSLLFTPKEIQQRWNPEIAAMRESEINTANKEASVAKAEQKSTPD